MSASVLADANVFGRKVCDVPGYDDCWVQFKISGYPRKLRRELDAARLAVEVWAMAMRYVEAWHIRTLAGDWIDLPAAGESRPIELMDECEDALAAWIPRAWMAFWLTELVAPRPNL